MQSKKIEDHIKIAYELLKKGSAYKCYCSSEELRNKRKGLKQKIIFMIENGEIKMRLKL